MAEIDNHFRARMAVIQHDMIALKWQTEELIKVSRQLVWTHHQLIEQRRALTTNAGAGTHRRASVGDAMKEQG